MKTFQRLQFIFLSISLAVLLSVVAKSADSAGFAITRNDDARVVFQCNEVAGALSYSIGVEDVFTGETIHSTTIETEVPFYVSGGGDEIRGRAAQVGVLEYARIYRVNFIRVFGIGAGMIDELHDPYKDFYFVAGQDILFNYIEEKFQNAEPKNTSGKPLSMGAGFYGAAFVCNSGPEEQNGTLHVGEHEFPVTVLPGPCLDIEFTGSNSIPMGFNYEVRVEGEGLSVYTVNLPPDGLQGTIIQ